MMLIEIKAYRAGLHDVDERTVAVSGVIDMARKRISPSEPHANGKEKSAGLNGFQIATDAYQTWVQGVGGCHAEAARFIGRRWAKDLELSAKLANCETPADMIALHSTFVQRMILDYAEEVKRVGVLGTRAFGTRTRDI